MDSAKILSIVIITKDTKLLLKDLLLSIERDTPLKPSLREVIVVDNGSTDGTNAMVREESPHAILVVNKSNLGFAVSANAGFRRSTGNFVLFLNSDTILIEGELSKMLRYMGDNPDVGICGPQLVYQDMHLQRSSAAIPSLISEIIPRAVLERFSPGKYSGKPDRSGRGHLSRAAGGEDEQGGHDVESLIGAAVMARRDAIERVGGFDERFFFFLEETDLCVRIRNEGFRVVLYPVAKVIHLQGKTVRKNWVNGRMEYNISMYKFISKHHGPFYYRWFQSVRFLKVTAFLIVLTCLPFFLIGERTRRTYVYYARLLKWHLNRCPDSVGLRPAML
jgi:N-acetylglucosaminyl-diphospho-decaprenol L-rhamnosyltransferase